jgi:hypothetical protein
MTPSGAASAAAAPERNSVRRSSSFLPCCPSSDIVLLLCKHARTLTANAKKRAAAWHRELFDLVQSRREFLALVPLKLTLR